MKKESCFLIGGKLGHSYSALIHRCWDRYSYELRPMPETEVAPFLREKAFHGINVTIPYKQLVMPFCSSIAPEARKIGSVNTIVKEKDGRLTGYNTDYAGFSFLAARAGIRFQGKQVLIFGNGGTTKTVQAVAGDQEAREIVVVSRRGPVTYDMLDRYRSGQILINATPVGMYPETEAMPFDPGDFPECEGVLDVIYNPPRTRLIQRAAELGIPCASGLWMLVEQARIAGEYFSGEPLDPAWTEKIHRQLERETENIVLIGMPGSGKSTAGRILGEKLNREAADTDAIITRKQGIAPAEIFARYGEKFFRQLERETIRELGREKGRIIITGGGAVLDPENLRNLKQNGTVFYLKRDLDRLETGKGRPLSADREALNRLAEQRLPIYEKNCDAVIENNTSSPEDAAELILKEWNS